jgi:flagellum-specific ATP synthase
LYAVYQDIEDLVNIGAYVPGVNSEYDLAVQSRPKILEYLKQEARQAATLEQSKKQLSDLVAWIDQLEKALKAQKAPPAKRK